ncbi:uncharacterized protein LOC120351093 [Nilaparvata lugens]|uniref:uncharacterized protein LOC120351093 n=1 Tax=Nilaparvata lugens TaxID=108931 RepID=UPI00193CD712|nr:uncharacterized protein LOC120351093 [Nilaparvata lugens]
MSLSNFLSSMSHHVGVVDIAKDDAEEEEAVMEHDLVSLGNLEEAPQQMEEAATAEVVAPQEDYAADEFFAKEVDESLKEFKTKATNFNPESPFEMCTRRFVEEQKDDLMKDLKNAEDIGFDEQESEDELLVPEVSCQEKKRIGADVVSRNEASYANDEESAKVKLQFHYFKMARVLIVDASQTKYFNTYLQQVPSDLRVS